MTSRLPRYVVTGQERCRSPGSLENGGLSTCPDGSVGAGRPSVMVRNSHGGHKPLFSSTEMACHAKGSVGGQFCSSMSTSGHAGFAGSPWSHPISARDPHRSVRHPRWDGGGAKRPSCDQGRAAAGEAGDAVDARRLEGFGQRYRRQDGGESPGQHRLASARGADEEDVWGTTPAAASRSPPPPGVAGTRRAPVRGHPCDPPTSKLSGSPRSPERGASAGSSGPAPRRS
jgi:hypothetical protein